jgi:hypothetical protein
MADVPKIPTETVKPEVKKEEITKLPLRCRLGLHKWGSKLYHDEKDSYVEHSIETCAYCGKEKKGTRKLPWDYSK